MSPVGEVCQKHNRWPIPNDRRGDQLRLVDARLLLQVREPFQAHKSCAVVPFSPNACQYVGVKRHELRAGISMGAGQRRERRRHSEDQNQENSTTDRHGRAPPEGRHTDACLRQGDPGTMMTGAVGRPEPNRPFGRLGSASCSALAAVLVRRWNLPRQGRRGSHRSVAPQPCAR